MHCACGSGCVMPMLQLMVMPSTHRCFLLCPVVASAGQLSYAITLLEAGQAALHFGELGISSLLGLAHDLLALIKLGELLLSQVLHNSDSSVLLLHHVVLSASLALCWERSPALPQLRQPDPVTPVHCCELTPVVPAHAASMREEGGATWRTDLRQYAALAPQQRLRLLLSLLGPGDSLASDLSMHVAPFLDRLRSSSSSSGSSDAVDAQVVLRQALEQEAAQRLSWVVRLVQCESRQLAAFSSSAQLAKTAGACCYACPVCVACI